MTKFEHDTYIILNLPEPFAEEIHRIRKKYDEGLTVFPAEITVAGSSGVGPLAYDQEPERVFTILNEIATSQAPIEACFKGIEHFQNTNLFYLAVTDPQPFIRLHEKVAGSGLKFNSTPYAYTPHCTLAGLNGSDEGSLKSIQEEPYSQGTFLLNALSVYDVTRNRCWLRYSTTLKGK